MIDKSYEEGRAEERDHIIERIGQIAQEQSAEGDVEGAHLLVELVRLLQLEASEVEIDDEETTDVEEMIDEAEADLSALLSASDDGLPPARERPDEDVMASMTSARLRQM